MYIDSDDARTDVVLAAAAAAFGGTARGLLSQIPGYPRAGLVAIVVDLAWIVALTALVPFLLARYRGDRADAMGLAGSRGGMRHGTVVVVPVVAAQLALGLIFGVAPLRMLLGRVGGAIVAGGAVTWLAVVGQIVVLSVGAVVLIGFLARRGVGWGRSPEMPLAQLLRTLGVGAAAVALLAGSVRAIGGAGIIVVLFNVAVLVAVVLIVDRVVPAGAAIPRAGVLAPVVTVGVLHLFAAGGLLRGDLLTALYAGGLAVGVTAASATLIHARRSSWPMVPLMVAIHWWPSCLSPLAFELARVC